MRRTLTVTLALGSLLGSAATLRAQTVPSPIRYIEQKQSVGLFGGYLFTDPSVGINEADVELGPQSGPLAGIRYNLRFGGPFSGEVRAAVSPTRRKVYRPGPEQDPDLFRPVLLGEDDFMVALADAGLVFHLTGSRTWHGLAPFVVGTGGVATSLGGSSALEEDLPDGALYEFGPSFAVGFGLGTDWFPTRRLSVRVEGRDRLWEIEVPQGLRPSNVREISEWKHNFSLSIGAALHF